MYEDSGLTPGEPERASGMDDAFIHDACTEALCGNEEKFATLLAHTDRAVCLKAINEFERQKSCCSWMQTRMACRVQELTVEQNRDKPNAHGNLERGAAANIALARHTGQRGSRGFLKACLILNHDTPQLAQRFAHGELTLEQVLAILAPLGDLTDVQRQQFDCYFHLHPTMFDGLGCKAIGDTVRKHTDQVAAEARTTKLHEKNQTRYLNFRQQDDCILISGRLPLEEGIALRKHLERSADRAIQKGDPRTRAQLICDFLVRHAITGTTGKLPLTVSIKLIMTDRALFQGDTEPAYLEGYGVLPASYARELIASAQDRLPGLPTEARKSELQSRIDVFPEIQRLFTAPGDKELVSMDSKARLFPPALREFIQIRDRRCRTPHCDNPATQTDHVHQWWLGGNTTLSNAALRCRSCNLAKEQPDWVESLECWLPHTINLSPTPGTNYQSLPPPATGPARDGPEPPEENPEDDEA